MTKEAVQMVLQSTSSIRYLHASHDCEALHGDCRTLQIESASVGRAMVNVASYISIQLCLHVFPCRTNSDFLF